MKALLDTHVFLWWIMDDERLTPYIRDFIADEGNDLFLSSASCWEIAIKAKIGRLKLTEITNDRLIADYDVKIIWDKKRRRH